MCPRLTDVELSADRAHRGNPVRPELRGKQLDHLLLKRVRAVPGLGRAARRNLGTPYDHHEELVRADQRDRGPRGHRRTGQDMSQTVRNVSRECRRDTQAAEVLALTA